MNRQERINMKSIIIGLEVRKKDRQRFRDETILKHEIPDDFSNKPFDAYRYGVARMIDEEIEWLDTMIIGVKKMLEG